MDKRIDILGKIIGDKNDTFNEQNKLSNEDYKILLDAEKFLRKSGFESIKEFEDVISKIAYILK